MVWCRPSATRGFLAQQWNGPRDLVADKELSLLHHSRALTSAISGVGPSQLFGPDAAAGTNRRLAGMLGPRAGRASLGRAGLDGTPSLVVLWSYAGLVVESTGPLVDPW